MSINPTLITKEDIPSVNESSPYDFRQNVQYHIYLFYKKFNQSGSYIISDLRSDEISDKVHSAGSTTYNSFGIFFMDTTSIHDDRQYVLYLNEEDLQSKDALMRKVESEKVSLGCSEFNFIAVEKIYNWVDERKRDNELICEVIPNTYILNSNFRVIEKSEKYTIRTLKGAEMIDVAPFFVDNRIDYEVFDKNAQSIFTIIDKLRELDSNKTVFYYGGLENRKYNKMCSSVFVILAAYLSVEKQMKFEIPNILESEYKYHLKSLVSQDNCFASSYVKLLQNPLVIGVSFWNNDAFICYKSNKPSMSTVTITSFEFVMEESNFFFREETLRNETYRASDIKVLKIEDVYGVTSNDWGIACQGIREIDKLCYEIEKTIQESVGVPLVLPVCFNNLLLFELNGEVRIGYLDSVKVNDSYLIKPMDNLFKEIEFQMNYLDRLFDLSITVDGFRYRKAFEEKMKLERNATCLNLDSCSRGILLDSLATNNSVFTMNSGFTVADIGVWSTVTKQLRGYHSAKVLKYVDNLKAWEKGLLSYFGGAHPAIRREINLSSTDWR